MALLMSLEVDVDYSVADLPVDYLLASGES